MRRVIYMVATLAATVGLLTAANPPWWASGSTTIIDNASPHDITGNYNAATVGQLKNVAKKAALYLNNSVPVYGAGGPVNMLVQSFQHNSGDYNVLTLGQLKAVAKPFYYQLMALGFDTKASLRSHSTPSWAYDYPWNPATPAIQNYQAATVGQLKFAFAFDLTGFQVTDNDHDYVVDSWEITHGLNANDSSDGGGDYDRDGLPNGWEMKWGMNPANGDENGNGFPDGLEDFDGDGLSNQEEAAFDLNPFSTDTDGDGLPDRWELANDFDPTLADDVDADRDGDTITNGEEAATGASANDNMPADLSRKVEIWTRMVYSQKDAQGSWQELDPSPWVPYTYIGAPTKQAPRMPPILWLALQQDGSYRWKGQFYFKNNSGSGPLTLTWTRFEHELDGDPKDDFKQVAEGDPVTLPPWQSSSIVTLDYPDAIHHAYGIMTPKVVPLAPETGFDDFERVTAPGLPPALVQQPWQMVPGGDGVQVDLLTNSNYTADFHADSSDPQMLDVRIGDTAPPATFNGTQARLTLKNLTTAEGINDYVRFYAENAASKVKLLRAARLPKLECAIQPYKVIWKDYPTPGQNRSPANMPSRQELETYINNVFEKQMNVHFTVKEFIPLGPMNFDIGAGIIYQGQYPYFAGDFALDILGPETETTDEEACIYTAATAAGGNTGDPTTIKVYFLPTTIVTEEPFTVALGICRFAKRSIFMTEPLAPPKDPNPAAKAKAMVLAVLAHQIGHMGLGAGGVNATVCLVHPRVNGKLDKTDRSGFPLVRQSDDLKRIMWWHPEDLFGSVFVEDEWMKFRASSPQ